MGIFPTGTNRWFFPSCKFSIKVVQSGFVKWLENPQNIPSTTTIFIKKKQWRLTVICLRALFREEWDTVVCDLAFGHPSKHWYTVLFSFELIFLKNVGGTKTTYPSFLDGDWDRFLFLCLGDSLVSAISLLFQKEQNHNLSTLLSNRNFKLILTGGHQHRLFHFQ